MRDYSKTYPDYYKYYEDGEKPQEGDVRYRVAFPCIYSACVGCGKLRWVRLIDGKPRNPRCNSCAAKLRHKVNRAG